ncbi:MAG: hypothetical protein EPN53_12165 [Acidobacteria bacterium]|nr:MAG: hypothetical protein EPN53_12165 [Acidobacteriota bacterium]
MYCPNPECLDFIEDGVPGEYVDTVSVCPKCGTRLVAGPPPEALGGSPQEARARAAGREDDPAVEVASFGSRQDAELAAGSLIARGIEAVVLADDAGGEFAGFGSVAGVRVLVPTSRVAEALALLEEPEPQGGEA